ncbi:MAG: cyclic nucleotide-binding domain-containing protein [Candidatus Tectomicrobia bacterium]|nr:cyclic nucleotide-binding domain-containing protein [Candidatus Tectomicrobia bacterium]
MGTRTDIETQSVDISLIRLCLQEVRLFAGLKDPHIASLCQLCRVVSYEAGDVIFHEGSVGTELFITVRGQVRVEIWLPREENTTSIYQVGNHEVFGEFALLDGHRRSATLVANGPLTVLVLSREELFTLMEHEPHMGFTIMRNLGNILATKLRNVNLDLRGLLANQKRLFNLVV